MRTPDTYCGDCRDVRLLYITTEKVVVCMGAHFTVIHLCVCFCPLLFHYSVNDFDIHLPYPAEHVFNNYFSVAHDIITRFSRERFFFSCDNSNLM